jgi:DNA end-binding protein Ku
MDVKDAELKLARQLIEQQSSNKFDPTEYKDDVSARVQAAIQKKVDGQEITVSEAPEGGAQIIDLMEALRASLEKKAAHRPRQRASRKRQRASRPSAHNLPHPRRARVQRNSRRHRSEDRCTSTASMTSKSCLACRAARFAR